MDEGRKYVLISRYYDNQGIERFKSINPLDRLLTIDEATKLSLKLEEKIKNQNIKGFTRIGEEITTIERYNVMLDCSNLDSVDDLLPDLSFLSSNLNGMNTLGQMVGKDAIDELIETVLKN